jgi:hypothetical protein
MSDTAEKVAVMRSLPSIQVGAAHPIITSGYPSIKRLNRKFCCKPAGISLCVNRIELASAALAEKSRCELYRGANRAYQQRQHRGKRLRAVRASATRPQAVDSRRSGAGAGTGRPGTSLAAAAYLGQVFDLGVRRVLLNRRDAILGGGLALVCLADRDDLAVARR